MTSERFSIGWSSVFPEGLRVLLVDNDPESSMNVENMLKKCNYQVRTCSLRREALSLLQERKDRFDIVITEFSMPDMDCFDFLDHVGSQMDIAVIVMSANEEMSHVLRVVEQGACYYLHKPIRLVDLQNIWLHVLKKRKVDKFQTMANETEQSDAISGGKRKDIENKNDDGECGGPSSTKKSRVVWTTDLHQKFEEAVNQIGLDKAGPKKILELMKVPWLKRENVASHLQKYRLHQSRQQKENELKPASVGINNLDISSKGSAENVHFQHLADQNILTTENYAAPGLHIHGGNIREGYLGTTFSMPMKLGAENALIQDVTDPHSSSGNSFNQSYGVVNSELMIGNQYTSSANAPSIHFQQQLNPMFQSFDRFDQHPVGKNRSYNFAESTNVKNGATFHSGQVQGNVTFDPNASSMWSTTGNQNMDQNLHDNLDSSVNNSTAGTRPVESGGVSLSGNSYAQNHDPVNFDSNFYTQ